MKANNKKTVLALVMACVIIADMTTTALAGGSVVTSSAVSSAIITHRGEESVLFNKEHRAFDRYELILGEMLYQEEDDDFYSKGFRPERTESIEGEVWREVYDYPIALSAVGLYRQLRATLRRHSYQEKYLCEREACGEVAGWKLYWGREIAGKARTQYYLVYAKAVAGQTEYILAYINEIDHQPRLVIERVSQPGRGTGLQLHLAGLNTVTYPAIRGEKMDLPSVFYESDAIEPSGDISVSLSGLVEQIKARPTQRFAVVGHADEQASPQYNFQLSLKRADYIRQFLLTQHQIDATRLMAYGMGESQPAATNETVEGRRLNRRVEFVRLAE